MFSYLAVRLSVGRGDDVVAIKLLMTLNSLFLVVATKPSFKEIRIGSPFLPENQSSASTDGSGPIVSG